MSRDPGSPFAPQITHACLHCGVPIASEAKNIGKPERCPGCRVPVVVPAQSQEVAPLRIVLEQISPKMFQWQCPQCGNSNKIRASSL